MRQAAIALVLIAVVLLWLLSGVVSEDDPPAAPSLADSQAQSAGDVDDRPPTRVKGRIIHASERIAAVAVRATTESKRMVDVSAMVSGRVAAAPVEKGTRVKAGDVLCQLEAKERQAWVDEGRANVHQAQLEYEGALKLRRQGYQSETQTASANAKLAAAQANLEQRLVELERTRIIAPFAGVVENRYAELGGFLQPGQACVTLVDPDPMLVIGQVAERDVDAFEIGQEASAVLIDGRKLSGRITFLGQVAQSTTRTYRVEMMVPNSDYSIRSGLTANLQIPKAKVMAHLVSSALLALDDAGGIGIRVANADNRVEFWPVNIIEDSSEGIWVTGLPETTKLITVGQELVVAGEVVDVALDDAASISRSSPTPATESATTAPSAEGISQSNASAKASAS